MSPGVVAGAAVLAAATFALRLAGLFTRRSAALSPTVDRLTRIGAVVLLSALATTSALLNGHHLAGAARPVGVAVGAVLAALRAPFVVVVLAAAAVTALLRAAGVG
jgi:branched-subunit amino acid transport protein